MGDDRLRRNVRHYTEYVNEVADIHALMNTSNTGALSLEEVHEHLHGDAITAFAESLDIEVADLAIAFGILSGYGTREIDLDTMITGCMRLKGPARSVDLLDMVMLQ